MKLASPWGTRPAKRSSEPVKPIFRRHAQPALPSWRLPSKSAEILKHPWSLRSYKMRSHMGNLRHPRMSTCSWPTRRRPNIPMNGEHSEKELLTWLNTEVRHILWFLGSILSYLKTRRNKMRTGQLCQSAMILWLYIAWSRRLFSPKRKINTRLPLFMIRKCLSTDTVRKTWPTVATMIASTSKWMLAKRLASLVNTSRS